MQYLLLAKYLLVDSKTKLAGLETSSWWALRTLLTHQRCLSERSPTLQSLLRDVSSTVLSSFGTPEAVQAQEWGHLLVAGEARVLAAAAQLEAGFAEHAFGHDNKARYAQTPTDMATEIPELFVCLYLFSFYFEKGWSNQVT